ncbi:polysaccharide biosynthesis protein [Thalassotalea fusca]
MIRKIDLIPSYVKLCAALVFDNLSICIAFVLAYVIRLGATHVTFEFAEWAALVTICVATSLMFYFFGIYRSVIRYFNATATLRVLSILCLSSVVFYLTGAVFEAFIPRSVPFLFLVIAACLIAGARASLSFLLSTQWFNPKEGVVIYGASNTGRQLANALALGGKYQPIAFLDEKQRYQGRDVFGLSVHSPQQLPKLIKRYGQFKVLIALSNVGPVRMKEIVAKVEPYALELLTIPSMSDIVSGKRQIDQLREVSVDELLGREPVQPIPELMSSNIKDKVVMVSGAGGSIGKELCRQIIQQQPTKLILLDVSEAFLYEIHQELSQLLIELDSPIELVPRIGNVQNGMLMTSIFHAHNVNTIYHAAAYKHVPLVEENVMAGIANNVMGTYEIAQAAIYCDVETFVLISTDKAVRPTNVMGATKRMAELVLQSLAPRDHNTRFVMVRFGNVLGSSGSVVPLFRRQIRAGGPITVTHPDIIRYFMTIPEAAQLVIQAGALGKGGDVFVLDMGKPVKIVDLAYKMTHLMGYSVKDETNPDGDIAIEYTGLRPGEKLYEELLIDDNAKSSEHERILTANERSLSWPEVSVILNELNDAMKAEDVSRMKRILVDAPLEYRPKVGDNMVSDECEEQENSVLASTA